MRRSGGVAVGCALSLAVATPAPAAPRVLDRTGVHVGALDGVLVWEGVRNGRTRLLRRIDGRTSAIPGVRRTRPPTDDPLDSGQFHGLDLGVDRSGRVVATYHRCVKRRCRPSWVVDVRSGGERRLKVAKPPRCLLVGQVALWGPRIAATLRCRGSGRSGVYLIRGRRARQLIPLSARRAEDGVALDQVSSLVVAASSDRVWAASTGCQEIVARHRANLADVHATPGQVWWGLSTAGDFGGSLFSFGVAAVGPACAISDTRVYDSFPELDWATGTFAVDGQTVYVAGRESGGLISESIE